MENNLNNRMNEKVLPIVAAVVGHSIWGFSYLFTRMALSVTSPDVLLTVRFSIAFLILNILILTGKFKLSLKGKSAGLLAAFSIMEPIYFYCESYGILYTNVTYSGVVLSIVPIVAMLFAAIFIKEYPAKRQLVFCILPIAGVIMITLSGSELGIIKPIGILLLAFTLFASAGYRTLNRKLAEKYTSFERTYFMIGVSWAVFVVTGLIKEKGDLSKFIQPLSHTEFLIPVIILSVFCSVLCYNIVNYAAGKMSVMTLAIYGTLTTICSMFSGVIFLGEPLTPVSFIGSRLIIFGVWQVTKAAPPDSSSGKASDVKGDADVKEAAGAVEAHDVKEAADSGENLSDHIFAGDSSEKI